LIGVRIPGGGVGNFSFPHRVQTGSGAHPPMQCLPGSRYLGVKLPGRESDHSPPASVDIKEGVDLYIHSPNTSS